MILKENKYNETDNNLTKKVIISLSMIILILLILFVPYTSSIQKTIPSVHKNAEGIYQKSYIYISGEVKSTVFRNLYSSIFNKNYDNDPYWYFKGIIAPAELIDNESDTIDYATDLQLNSNGELYYLHIIDFKGGGLKTNHSLDIISDDNMSKIIIFENLKPVTNIPRDVHKIPFWLGPEFSEESAYELFEKQYISSYYNLTKRTE
ncbi:hypothetical protein [Fastidiosipila sanguinis]|uniref:Uncharacterized protein n=1 Tax=Fastidiosipila sanguinis TaxID=236753 RepID=A0A2S0KPP9_9FIRM|nr:hypothetical protein [Fastidiosipila sanguinis]AVM42979.1 hypothetical protein C5Q98_07045 [Fastidiosipila sanguinis]